MNHDPSSGTAAARASGSDYRLIDFGKVVRLLWRYRVFLIACILVSTLLSYGASLLIHPQYDATVRLMPPSSNASSLLESLSPSRNQGDLYLGLIGSRTVADDVIEHQHLADYFKITKPSQLRAMLGAMAKISVDRDQFVTVVVRAREPETAVRVANAFPEALSRLNHAVALSQAAHRWEFFEGPLEIEKNKLADAEEQLKIAQQKTGMVLPEAQVQLGLSAIASLKQQLAARNEQLAALETGSTDQNPQVVSLKSQIASISGQIARLQAQNGGPAAIAGKSSAQMPELTLEIDRLAREVKYHQTLFEVLQRQYENARIEDSYSAPVELVDQAVLPDTKSYPSRRLFAVGGLFFGLFFGLAIMAIRTLHPVRRFVALLNADASAGADASHG
jgi:uncharacterized protein involved in exopolysaccharide biosynthesis